MFRVELLAAGYGDALWMEYGSLEAPHRILIDGGPPEATQALHDRVGTALEAGRGRLHLELVVVTHIDSTLSKECWNCSKLYRQA
jgi:hypothetical protein